MIPIKDREKIDRIVQFTPAPVGLLSLFVVYEMYLLLWGWCLKKDRSLMCYACIGIWILLFFLFIRRNVIAFAVRNRLVVPWPNGNLARCVMVPCWSTVVQPQFKLDSTRAVGGLVELGCRYLTFPLRERSERVGLSARVKHGHVVPSTNCCWPEFGCVHPWNFHDLSDYPSR